MLNVPIEGGSEVKNSAEGFEADSGSGCFVVVDAKDLGEAFGNVANFISSDVSCVVAFAFADKFPFERALTTGDGGSGDEDENFEVRETLKFFSPSSNPIFSFR